MSRHHSDPTIYFPQESEWCCKYAQTSELRELDTAYDIILVACSEHFYYHRRRLSAASSTGRSIIATVEILKRQLFQCCVYQMH